MWTSCISIIPLKDNENNTKVYVSKVCLFIIHIILIASKVVPIVTSDLDKTSCIDP